jgi:hypothetical protein
MMMVGPQRANWLGECADFVMIDQAGRNGLCQFPGFVDCRFL